MFCCKKDCTTSNTWFKHDIPLFSDHISLFPLNFIATSTACFLDSIDNCVSVPKNQIRELSYICINCV